MVRAPDTEPHREATQRGRQIRRSSLWFPARGGCSQPGRLWAPLSMEDLGKGPSLASRSTTAPSAGRAWWSAQREVSVVPWNLPGGLGPTGLELSRLQEKEASGKGKYEMWLTELHEIQASSYQKPPLRKWEKGGKQAASLSLWHKESAMEGYRTGKKLVSKVLKKPTAQNRWKTKILDLGATERRGS